MRGELDRKDATLYESFDTVMKWADSFRKIGVRANTTSEIIGTDRTSLFSINSVQFSLRNTDWDSLKRFYLELSQRSPYIGIEQFSLTVNPANPTLLTATLRVSSVEIVR